MNVLLITVRSDFGGGPRHVNQLIEGLPQSINVYLACPDGEPYGNEWRMNSRIKGVVTIPFREFSLSTLLLLRRYAISNKIDIIHSHGNGAGLYSRFIKILYPSVKIVHTFHGISDNYSSKIKSAVSNIVGIVLSPFANKYIAVSNGEKSLALEKCFSKEDNTVVIYNGIKDIVVQPKQTQNNPLHIVTLSRFDYPKNMDSLYRIALNLKDLPLKFIWVGDGPDKFRLEQLAKLNGVNIEFIGFSNSPMKYLKGADWYMSTSRFEGLPYALIEAASVGLPIIASNVKGNNEVVFNNKNGFLFQSEEEAIEIMRKIVNDDVNYKQLSFESIALFKQYFTDKIMLAKLIDLYNNIIL